ncbi:pentapeptide repeat-containing protein [Nonomuraea sp. NN258]|uniref:pentapeptide repeat-containing protein n=1 Tax=Nonomuraea antri TaxID=2730852 RepID=UPI0015694F04|nr:pentapeptide repeat-containing protein [Nonomuraea antri]NRQ33394.1 pentapeptide repeat-containing protein [Nonomuraea antri]
MTTVRGESRDRQAEVVFDRARAVNADFTETRFAGFFAHDSEFERCDFSGAAFDQLSLGGTRADGQEWDGVAWPRTVFRDCVFRRTRFATFTHFGNVRFERCTFDRSRLRGQTATQEAEFVDCVFLGPVRDINFFGRPPARLRTALGRDRNDFSGNDFTAAELDDVSFRDIDLHAQRFPGPPGYALLDRVAERAGAVLALVEGWPDGEHRREARYALEFLAGTAAEWNAGHALVTPAQLGRRLPPALREELFQAFRRTSSDTSRGRAAPPGEPGHVPR